MTTHSTDKLIVNNVRKVLETHDIGNLRPKTYRFIIAYMGFIAHYNLDGFKAEYRDLRVFCISLQTSEYSTNFDYNDQFAERLLVRAINATVPKETDAWKVAYTIKDVVALAREYMPHIEVTFAEAQKEQELAQAETLAAKYGYRLEPTS